MLLYRVVAALTNSISVGLEEKGLETSGFIPKADEDSLRVVDIGSISPEEVNENTIVSIDVDTSGFLSGGR